MTSGRPSNLRALALGAAVLIGGAALVLYVIRSAPVHETQAAAAPPSGLTQEKPAAHLPPIAFSDPKGIRHLLSEYRGRYVLVNLWATWCGPCVKELPSLAKLQDAIPKDRLLVLTVNTEHGAANDMAPFLKNHNAGALPANRDVDYALVRQLRAVGLPLTVLVDPDGQEIARAEGPLEWDAPETIGYFRALSRHAAS